MIEKIGVIGAGQMGSGIAHVCALAKFDVYLLDVGKEQLKKAMESVARHMDHQVEHKMIKPADKAAALKRIKTGIDYKPFKDCDLVIETATQKKRKQKRKRTEEENEQ